MDSPMETTQTTFMRISRTFLNFPIFCRQQRGSKSKSNPASRFMTPRETPSTGSISPMAESLPGGPLPTSISSNAILTANGTNSPQFMPPPFVPLLRPDEVKLASQTLNKALKEVDFGCEVVIRLLNDKRSLFKSLLARCASQAHEIEVFDVHSLARFCPRAVQVGDGVTRFFERVAIELEKEDMPSQLLEAKINQMCRANGQMHYRMKVWFQAENWLCVKHSVVDTVLMANSNLKRGKHLKSAGDIYGISSYQPNQQQQRQRYLNRFDTFDYQQPQNGWRNAGDKQSIEVVWMKLMQAIITWMKQGFLESAMSGKEEQDEEL